MDDLSINTQGFYGPMEYIKPEDINYLYGLLLDNNQHLKVLPYKIYKEISKTHLRLFAHFNAIYTFPTLELANWLLDNYDMKSAIEIGCGHGSLARHLNIPATDGKIQEYPDANLIYNISGQTTIKYPDYVEKLTANEAIVKYKPKTVIACWCTQLYDENEHYRGGSIYGVDETELIKQVDNYVFIGNQAIHGMKKILEFSHNTFKPEWIVSRSQYTECNIIYIWEK